MGLDDFFLILLWRISHYFASNVWPWAIKLSQFSLSLSLSSSLSVSPYSSLSLSLTFSLISPFSPSSHLHQHSTTVMMTAITMTTRQTMPEPWPQFYSIIVVWISERSTLASDGASGCSKPSDRTIIFSCERWRVLESTTIERCAQRYTHWILSVPESSRESVYLIASYQLTLDW